MSTTLSSTNQNENQSNINTSNERIRKREDPTVSTLRFNWQIFISRMIHLSSTCKAADSSSSNPNNNNNNNNATVQQNIAFKAKEVIDKQNELKKSIGRMENIIRGREEEMKGLVLDRGSAGVAGRKRRKCQLQKEQESVGGAANFFLGE
jgi:hypothetical protein